MAGRPRAAPPEAPAPSAAAPASDRAAWPFAAVPVLAAALAHANALGNPFVYDDFLTVVQNPSLGSLTSLDVLRYSPFRPLVNVSYAVDHAVWGLAPFGFHLTNLALHLACVALFFFWVKAVAVDAGRAAPEARFFALACALVFGVHPLMTETVGYVSARSELLCAAFALLSVLLLREALVSRRPGPLVAGALCWLAALASKEVAVAVPPALWLYDRLLLPGEAADRRWRLMRVHLPLFGVLAVGAVARLGVFLRLETDAHAPSLTNLVQQCGVVFRYVGLFVFPLGQTVMHSVEDVASLWSAALLPPLAWAAVCALLFWRRRALPRVAWGVAWFLLVLLPSSSLVVLNEPMSEHRTYVAALGLTLALMAGLTQLPGLSGWPEARRRWLAQGALAAVALALAALTVSRNQVWASEVSLWQDAAQKSPQVWAARYAAGDALRAAGRCAEAVAEYEAAIALVPAEPRAHGNLGICFAELRRYPEAERAFERAAELDPGDAALQRNLGRLAELTGQPAKAAAHFARAAQLDAAARP